MEKKNRNTILIIGIALLFVAITYTAYALFSKTDETSPNQISTGNITMAFTEGDTVNLETEGTLTDDEGKNLVDYFNFSINAKAENKLKLAYYIYATPDASNTIDPNYVKVYLSKVSSSTDTGVINPTAFGSLTRFNLSTMAADNTANNYLIYSNTFNFTDAGEIEDQYHLRIWLAEGYTGISPTTTNTDNGTSGASHQAVIESKTFKFKINVYSEQGDVKL